MTLDTPYRLTGAIKASYGFGAFATGVGNGASLPIVAIFANQVLGLPAELVGMTIMVSVIVDAVCDPLIGRWSDRCRSRWGRRHPFMYVSGPLAALGIFLLWHPPTYLGAYGIFGYILATQLCVRLSISLFEIPSVALAPELAPDYHERTSLLSYRKLFAELGRGLPTMVLYAVFLRKDAAHPLGILNGPGYAEFGSLCAMLVLVPVLGSALVTHRFAKGLARPPLLQASLKETIRELVATFNNISLRALIGSGLISGLWDGIGGVVGGYFFLYFWEFSPQMYTWLVPLVLSAAAIGTWLAPLMTRRFDKKKTLIITFFVSSMTAILPIGLRLAGLLPANGTPWLVGLVVGDGIISRMVGVIAAITISSMIADLVEDVAVVTNTRSEGVLFSVDGLLPKVTAGVGAFFGGLLLSTAHFPVHAQPGTVSLEVLHTLGYLFLPIGIILNFLAVLVLLPYRINEAVHRSNIALIRGRVID